MLFFNVMPAQQIELNQLLKKVSERGREAMRESSEHFPGGRIRTECFQISQRKEPMKVGVTRVKCVCVCVCEGWISAKQ